jgi:lysyl-tRNA synthetase class 2
MKPEVSKPKSKKEGFIKIGVDEKWIEHIMELYSNIENLLSEKPTQVHQKLNGYRKKTKLTIDPLQLEDVEKWFN